MLVVSRGTARLARMGGAFLASSLAQMAIGFAISLVIGRGLGFAEFGRWTFLTAWAGTLTMAFDLGTSALVTRDAARDRPNAGRLVAAALAVRFVAIAPVALLIFVAAPWLSQETTIAQTFRITIWLAAASLAYGAFAAAFRAWPEWLPAILGVEAGAGVVQCLAALWLVRSGGGVDELLRLTTAVQLMQLAAAIALWRVARGESRLQWPSWRDAWALVRSGYPFAVLGVVGNAQARLAPLLLGYLSTPGAVAAFGVASRFGNAARMIPHAGFASAFPLLSYEFEHGEPHALRREFHGVVRWFAVLAAAGLAIAAQPILVLTYGESFASAAPVVVWIAVGLLPSLVNNSRKVFLYASGQEAVAVKWTTVSMGVQLVAAAALIPSLAAVGAAFAMLLGDVVVWWPLRQSHRVQEEPGPHGVPGRRGIQKAHDAFRP